MRTIPKLPWICSPTLLTHIRSMIPKRRMTSSTTQIRKTLVYPTTLQKTYCEVVIISSIDSIRPVSTVHAHNTLWWLVETFWCIIEFLLFVSTTDYNTPWTWHGVWSVGFILIIMEGYWMRNRVEVMNGNDWEGGHL